MNVLVWQQYGMISVYAAETPLQFLRIYDEVKAAMDGWGEEQMLAELYDKMGAVSSRAKCEILFKRAIQRLIGTHDLFEAFEFTTIKG